jgi:hypothetical protein
VAGVIRVSLAAPTAWILALATAVVSCLFRILRLHTPASVAGSKPDDLDLLVTADPVNHSFVATPTHCGEALKNPTFGRQPHSIGCLPTATVQQAVSRIVQSRRVRGRNLHLVGISSMNNCLQSDFQNPWPRLRAARLLFA